MTRLECAVGLVGLPAGHPLPLQLAGLPLAHYVAQASTAAAGTPAIELDLLPAKELATPGAATFGPDAPGDGTPGSGGPGAAVDAYDLHRATRRLAGNPPSGAPVSRIALLFARRYAPRRDLFGVMFDRGFATPDDPNAASSFTRFPRQGCAVFLDAIAAHRAPGADFDTEAAVTALHELGHLFNLGDLRRSRSFMADAGRRAPSPASFRFTAAHCGRLRLGSTSPHVWPGGSRYGDLGFLAADAGEDLGAPARGGLELQVEMCQRELLPVEPVELEIRLGVAPGVDRPYLVPDVLDPGYAAFTVWIERPDRERVRYRPCNLYCRNPGHLTIGPGAPFERDLSVFGQSGGYTFRQAGVHRVWAELRLPGFGILASRAVEVRVLPQPVRGRRERLARLLAEPAAARALFYRAGEGAACLETICAEFPDSAAAAASHYALGRLLLRERGRRRAAGRRRRLRDAAREHLARAGQHERQSWHRRLVAERLLESGRR